MNEVVEVAETMDEARQKAITQFRQLLSQAVRNLAEAGNVCVHMMDNLGMSAQEVAEQSGGGKDVIIQLERIGRKQLNPILLTVNYPACSYMTRIAKSDQDRLLSGPLEVLIVGKNDEVSILQIDAENLTFDQCRQVFDRNKVRDIPAQRAWIESQKAKAIRNATPGNPSPYSIDGKSVIIHYASTRLTPKQLVRMLNEMGVSLKEE